MRKISNELDRLKNSSTYYSLHFILFVYGCLGREAKAADLTDKIVFYQFVQNGLHTHKITKGKHTSLFKQIYHVYIRTPCGQLRGLQPRNIPLERKHTLIMLNQERNYKIVSQIVRICGFNKAIFTNEHIRSLERPF